MSTTYSFPPYITHPNPKEFKYVPFVDFWSGPMSVEQEPDESITIYMHGNKVFSGIVLNSQIVFDFKERSVKVVMPE